MSMGRTLRRAEHGPEYRVAYRADYRAARRVARRAWARSGADPGAALSGAPGLSVLLALLACSGGCGGSGAVVADAAPAVDTAAAADAAAAMDAAPDDRLLIVPALQDCDADAAPLERIRVVSWNVHAARDASYDALAAELAALDADVIVLQEVDGFTPVDNANQAEEVATRLGHPYAFAEVVTFQGRVNGHATLTRLPVAAVRRIPLESAAASQPRVAFEVTVCFGPYPVQVVNVHMDYEPEGNLDNTRDMLAAGALGQDILFVGDFNVLPGTPGIGAMLDAGYIDVVAPHDDSPTWKDRRLDYVFAGARLAGAIQDARVVQTDRSDHHLVVSDFAGAL